MRFDDVCERVIQYQQTHDDSQFQRELSQIQQRLDRAVTRFHEQQPQQHTDNNGFFIFWCQKRVQDRLEMIDKVTHWLGLMPGANWCGIQPEEWLCLTNTTNHNDGNSHGKNGGDKDVKEETCKTTQSHQNFFQELCTELCTNTELITNLDRDYCFKQHDTMFVKKRVEEILLRRKSSQQQPQQQSQSQSTPANASTTTTLTKKQKEQLVTLLATFKRFVAYFVINGLVVLYQSLEKARRALEEQQQQQQQQQSS